MRSLGLPQGDLSQTFHQGKSHPTREALLQQKKADSDKSWSVEAKGIDKVTFDLSVKNPNGGEEVVHRSPVDIMEEIALLDQ